MKCFIDMDGVLADFVGAASKVHNRPWPYLDPKNLGIFEIEDAWGITSKQFWEPIDAIGKGFWTNLDKTPEADHIITFAIACYGLQNICILTSPSDDPGCVPGKRAWLKHNYPELGKNILFGSAKGFLAGPGRVLIDDRDKNIDDFRRNGGISILVPRPWNRAHACEHPMAQVLFEIADSIRGGF